MYKAIKFKNNLYLHARGIVCEDNQFLHNRMRYVDTRDSNEKPSYYRERGSGTYKEFKNSSFCSGVGETYCMCETHVPWGDSTGGRIYQEVRGRNGIFYRVGSLDDSSWESWTHLQKSLPVLVGMFPILHVPFSTTTLTSGAQVGYVYSFKDNLEAMFPKKSGFKRKYVAVSSIETGDNTLKIYLGGYEIAGDCLWGSNSPQHARVKSKDVTSIIEAMGYGHAKITYSNVKGASGNSWAYCNSIYLLVYDEFER